MKKPWEMKHKKTCMICKESYIANSARGNCCGKEECLKMKMRLYNQTKKYKRKASKTKDPKLKKQYLEWAKSKTIIPETRECYECGVEFILKNGMTKYCGDDCKKIGENKQQMKRYYERRKKEKYEHDQIGETTSLKRLMDEYESLKARKIDPYFLSRGKTSNGAGIALTDGY